MIKGFALIPQKAGITREKFHSHWFEIHAPLAQRITALRRYVQSHRLADPLPGFDAVPYEGIAEIWFDQLSDVTKLGENPEYVDFALADEPNFIDQSLLRFLATREEVVIPGPPIEQDTQGVKALFLLKRRTDMSVAQFQKYWLEEHAPQIPRTWACAATSRRTACRKPTPRKSPPSTASRSSPSKTWARSKRTGEAIASRRSLPRTRRVFSTERTAWGSSSKRSASSGPGARRYTASMMSPARRYTASMMSPARRYTASMMSPNCSMISRHSAFEG